MIDLEPNRHHKECSTNVMLMAWKGAGDRQCCPVSATDSILVASARGSVCLTSVRGIVASLDLAFSMHARFLSFACSLVG